MEKKKMVGRDLTEGSVMRALITFAIPMLLAQLLQQFYSAEDLAIAGKFVGPVGTVAVATGGELTDFVTMVAMAIATGAQIYIAQLAGARDEKNLKEAVGTTLTVLAGLAVVVMAGLLLFHTVLLDMLNCPEDAYQDAAGYMMITALGIPFVFGYNAISCILRAMGNSSKPLLFIAVATTVNIFADLFFVAWLKMGAIGTAIATTLSQLGSFAAAFLFLMKNRESFDFELKRSYFKVSGAALRRILYMAVPQLIRTLCVQSSQLWVKAQVNTYGMVFSSTYSIGNKIEKFMQVFVHGVDGAAGAMIGQNIGARKYDRVKTVLWDALAISMGIAALVIAAFLTLPTQLFGIFTSDTAVQEMGIVFLRIMSLGMVIVAFSSCFKSIATGAGAAFLSLVIGVMDGVSRVLACLVFYHVFHQGAQSYFWGAAFCMLIPGIISFAYFLSGKWRTKKLLSET